MTINWAQVLAAGILGFLVAVLLVDPVKMLRDRAIRKLRRLVRKWWRRIRPPSRIPATFHFGPIDTQCRVVLGDGVHPFSRIVCSFDSNVWPRLPETAELRIGVEQRAEKDGWHDGEILQLLDARQTEDAAETERYLELTVAQSTFYDFCASNLELDSQLKSGGTLRSIYLNGSDWTRPVKGLGNGFSVNFFVTTSDHQLLFTKRTKGVTTYPDAWMVSVGGFMMNRDLPRDEDPRYRSPFRAAVREANRELRLDLDLLAVDVQFTSLTVDTRLSGWYLLGHAALPLTAEELGRLIGAGTLEKSEFARIEFLPLDPEAILAWITSQPGAWVPGSLVCLYHLLEVAVGRSGLEAVLKREQESLRAAASAIFPWPSEVILTGTPLQS